MAQIYSSLVLPLMGCISLVSMVWTSWICVGGLALNGVTIVALAIYVLTWLQMLLGFVVLSELGSITPEAFLVWNGFSLALAGVFGFQRARQHPPFSRHDFRCIKEELRRAGKTGRLLMASFAGLLLTTLIIGVWSIPNQEDSLSYHLARAAYWLQSKTFDIPNTWDFRQDSFPFAGDSGFLWVFLFFKTDRLVFLVQWFAYVFLAVAVWRTCAFLLSRQGAGFLMVVFMGLPCILLQSTCAYVDITLASFFAIAICFAFASFKTGLPRAYLFLTGVAIGIAGAIKSSGCLLLGVFLLWYAAEAVWRYSANAASKIAWLVVISTLCSFMLLCPTWIQNAQRYQNCFGPRDTLTRFQVNGGRVSAAAAIQNAAKTVCCFCDFGTAIRGGTRVRNAVESGLERVFDWAGWNRNDARTTCFYSDFHLPDSITSASEAYYGPIGFFFLLPSSFLFPFLAIFRSFRVRMQMRGLDVRSVAWLCVLGWLFLLGFCSAVKWQPNFGRMLMPFAVACMPALGWVFYVSSTGMRWISIAIISGFSIFTAVKCALFSGGGNLLPTKYESSSLLTWSNEKRRFYYYTGARKPEVLRVIESRVPSNGRLGVSLHFAANDLIYFGDCLTRTVIPLAGTGFSKHEVFELMSRQKLDGCLVLAERIRDLQECRRTEPARILAVGRYCLFIP